ncbi:MAG: Cysteine desulfurase [candidate division TA06 bacterium 32_111]|uniref:Cysteine desulfurase n=2 Tax=Bacteria candidate phyla TaxID=1783234 RepID=A0A101I2B8_UNCT6|nr:MAG: Cysteine desulfurase [candidate division TA06 bacterium 32_111]KUK87481.1 MAG: Cysteine desulfurase [candidate division TA06 bacterium 34_109]HAF08182.1 hypothetical protein [candidate division WOR-3 bacterium]HCP16744.1 hypothetical protein [candidate division WOR-3 bacterium]
MKDYKKYFPFFKYNPKKVYLDSACMGLKPYKLIESINEYYLKYSICAGRSTYRLSKELEERLDISREKISKLINAKSKREIVWTRNTTESINLFARSFKYEKDRRRVIITEKEHNSNHCVWKELSKKGIIELTILDSNRDNTFNLNILEDQLKKGDVILVSTVHVSNLDGIENPIKKIADLSHKYGAYIFIDAAQSVPHTKVDVVENSIDFMAFSIHKIYGPTGLGVLYVKNDLFDKIDLYNVGGDTIKNTFILKDPEYRTYPYRYEAGLANFSAIYSVSSIVDFVEKIGYENIEKRVNYLNNLFRKFLKNYEEIKIIGDTDDRNVKGITTFFIKKFTRFSEDEETIGEKFDRKYGILLRTGFFCVNPYFDNRERKGEINPLHYPAIRASFGFYNDEDDLEKLEKSIKSILKSLKGWPTL